MSIQCAPVGPDRAPGVYFVAELAGGRDGEDRDVRVACAANFGRADEHAPLLRLTSLDQLDAFQAAAVADRLQRFVTGGGDAKAVRAKLVRMAASVRREWAKAET